MLPLTDEAARNEAARNDVVNENLREEYGTREEVVMASDGQETSTPADAPPAMLQAEVVEAEVAAATQDAPETVVVANESVETISVENIMDAAHVDEAAPEMSAGQNDEDGMASSSERMTILRMVEQGKISAEDGARLLAALSKSQAAESKPRPNPFDASRQLQVRVYDLASNRAKVNVALPVGLLQWAWRWLPTEAQSQLAQVQAAIESGASGRLVEVVDQESSVRVEITLI